MKSFSTIGKLLFRVLFLLLFFFSSFCDAQLSTLGQPENGNLRSYLQSEGASFTTDHKQYSYIYDTELKNRLIAIKDEANGKTYHFKYNKIGQVIQDELAGNKVIEWNVYGKISRITRYDGTLIEYRYDGLGRRIAKAITRNGKKTEEFYVTDPQGNILAIYYKNGDEPVKHTEQHLYGIEHIGTVKIEPLTGEPVHTAEELITQRQYYLKNHLGNVLAVVSDKKIGIDTNGDGVVDRYEAEVLSQQDYYSFGAPMPGRTYHSDSLRYGFNSKENDPESGYQNYGMRYYNPEIARFISVDPLTAKYPWYTPYQFAGNKPIWALDLDGAEEWYYNHRIFGWTASKLYAGPYNEETSNKLGYYSAQQVHNFRIETLEREKQAERRKIYLEAVEGVKTINRMNNPFGIAVELNPLSGIPAAYEAADNGQYTAAAVFAVGSFADLGPLLKIQGKAFTMLSKNLAAKYSIDATWNLPPIFRGILVESRLASKYAAQGFEWMAESTSKFFKGFDFYNAKDGVAVSLKTVNAKTNFDFTNIKNNIEELANLKAKGASAWGGVERKINEVRLDIAVPKGYDQNNLKKVRETANQAGVQINIFEH